MEQFSPAKINDNGLAMLALFGLILAGEALGIVLLIVAGLWLLGRML